MNSTNPINPINPIHFFRELEPDSGRGQPAVDTDEETLEAPPDGGAPILCRLCGQVVSRADQRMTVEGQHRHTFANPHGLVFEIGCFKNVTGCAHAGPPSTEFAWFAGCTWRVTVCGGCLSHLGWQFISGAGGGFYGLILDRIVEGPPPASA